MIYLHTYIHFNSNNKLNLHTILPMSETAINDDFCVDFYFSSTSNWFKIFTLGFALRSTILFSFFDPTELLWQGRNPRKEHVKVQKYEYWNWMMDSNKHFLRSGMDNLLPISLLATSDICSPNIPLFTQIFLEKIWSWQYDLYFLQCLTEGDWFGS